jgi:hypothetical protein
LVKDFWSASGTAGKPRAASETIQLLTEHHSARRSLLGPVVADIQVGNHSAV